MALTSPTPDGDLSVAALLDEAAAGVGEVGDLPVDVPFTGTLALLVTSCHKTAALNSTGERVLHKVAVRHLRNLLYLQAYVAAHPDVAGRPLEGAVVVTGLPRTGTTLVHNLLSLDPAHRFLRLWEALHPIPPEAGGPPAETRIAQAERWLDAFYRMVPEFQTIHAATPTGPEECDALLQNTFASQHFDDMFDAEEYSAWLATAPLSKEYGHYGLQLRVLSRGGASPAGTAGARWALKSPSHLGHLDALLAALPGATVVHCHRAPRQAVASYASLIHALRRAYSDRVSPTVVGRQALTRASTAMARALDVRRSAGERAFVDVAYHDLVTDPLAAVRSVYQRLGQRLVGDTEDRMRQWLASNRQHKHCAHRYGLARFGLREDEVDAAFGPYLERFGSMAGT
jgi:hypothetical protein